MKEDMNLLFNVTSFVVFAIIVLLIFVFNKRKKRKNKEKNISDIDYELNVICSTPISSELEKVETIIKNEKMEEKYNNWLERYKDIKERRIPELEEMVSELEMTLIQKDHSKYDILEAKLELELYKLKTANDSLLQEIKDVNLSEEKYRTIITKLKFKYRELNNIFLSNKEEYGEFFDIIELQFENIERRFQDFEDFMEKNEYDEVIHIVKAIDTMIEHMAVIVEETPNLVLLAIKVIPKRIKSINQTYEELLKEEYPLDYLNVSYNVDESIKNINSIVDRIKVLNLDDCLFELTTMLAYLDSLFEDFEKEKNSRKYYDNNKPLFEERLRKVNLSFDDIYNRLADIKNNYYLSDEEVLTLEDLKKDLDALNILYKKLLKNLAKKKIPYSQASALLGEYSIDLSQLEGRLEFSLKTLGNMYEDEQRAREQLGDILDLLLSAKIIKRTFIFSKEDRKYDVQLSEAKEASLEVSKELSKKPIDIKILNTRVDTARDLSIKLYTSSKSSVRKADLCEKLLVYANRFRSSYQRVDEGLDSAYQQFYKGNYSKSLEIVLNVLDLIDKGIRERYLDEVK